MSAVSSTSIRSVTADDFSKLVLADSAERLVLVDFWAEWCGPCKALGPILEEVTKARPDLVTIVKVDTDEESALAVKYGIRALPTMLVFRGGEMVDQLVGLRSAADIIARLDAIAAPKAS